MELLLAAFIVVQTADGREATINSDQIASMHTGKDGESNKLMVDKVHCIIGMVSGKFISLTEECDDVLRKLQP
jgi:uncharacterized protein YlzI (FlbEa/FlbD family)